MLSKMSSAHLKLICTKGMGIVVARALEDPSLLLFKDIATSFVGDGLTQAEASEDFKASYGKPMPAIFRFVGTWFGVKQTFEYRILGGCDRMPEASPRNARLYQSLPKEITGSTRYEVEIEYLCG